MMMDISPCFKGPTSLGPRPKINTSVDCFQYRVILEAIYVLEEVWGGG